SVGCWVVADVLMYRRVKFRRPRFRASVTEIRNAATLFVGTIGATLYTSFNVVLLGFFQPSADVAHFGAAERAVRVSLSVLGPIGMAAYPRLVALHAEGRRERARKLLMLMVAAVALPGLVIAAALAVFAPTIIGIVY